VSIGSFFLSSLKPSHFKVIRTATNGSILWLVTGNNKIISEMSSQLSVMQVGYSLGFF